MQANYQIVVLSYNHPQLTAQTINSVLAFGFKPSGIHLVHNGSLPKHRDELMDKFPLISHLVLDINKGFSGGANFGLSLAFQQTDSVLFLTNDTEVLQLPERFPPETGFFSVSILKRNTEVIDSVIGHVNLRTGHLSHLKTFDEAATKKDWSKIYIPGTAFGLTKNVFQKIGGFDETLHTYWEDVDFSLKAQAAYLKLGFCPHFKIKHKIGKTCHKDRFYTLFLFQRNRKRIVHRHSPETYKIRFYLKYTYDMFKIAKHIALGPNKKINFRLWWKAIYDFDN